MSDSSDQGRFELAGYPLWVIAAEGAGSPADPYAGTVGVTVACEDGATVECVTIFTDEAQAVDFVLQYADGACRVRPLGKAESLGLLDYLEGKGHQYVGIDLWPGRGGGGAVPIPDARELFAGTPEDGEGQEGAGS